MKRILLTGMSGTGKSTVVRELVRRGYRAIDTDDDGWSHWIDMRIGRPTSSPGPGEYRWDDLDWVWNEERICELLGDDRGDVLILAGTAANQGEFYAYFDAIVLLSAPASVIAERLAQRTDNPYGGTPRTRARAMEHIETVEPLLRTRCDYEIVTTRPLEEVVTCVLEIIRS